METDEVKAVEENKFNATVKDVRETSIKAEG